MAHAEKNERLDYALDVIREQEWVLQPTQGKESLGCCELEIKGSFGFVDVDLLLSCCAGNVQVDADENGVFCFFDWDDAIADYHKTLAKAGDRRWYVYT